MNWLEAVATMKHGKHVRRASESRRVVIDQGDDLNPAIVDAGTEPMFLAAAWTADDEPVMIFAGVHSKLPFVPDDEHRAATDWRIES